MRINTGGTIITIISSLLVFGRLPSGQTGIPDSDLASRSIVKLGARASSPERVRHSASWSLPVSVRGPQRRTRRTQNAQPILSKGAYREQGLSRHPRLGLPYN